MCFAMIKSPTAVSRFLNEQQRGGEGGAGAGSAHQVTDTPATSTDPLNYLKIFLICFVTFTLSLFFFCWSISKIETNDWKETFISRLKLSGEWGQIEIKIFSICIISSGRVQYIRPPLSGLK